MSKKPTHKGAGSARAPLSFSQNFLTGRRTIHRLLDLTDTSSGDLVVEIGPGKGRITMEVLPKCSSLQAAEWDPVLCARLQEIFSCEAKFSLFQGDFFSIPLPDELYKVFSNIPFSRTTDIVRRLAWGRSSPETAWLLMEKGAALRFCGKPHESQAALLRPFFQTGIWAQVSRQEFHPAPRLDTALLCLRKKAQLDLPWD